MNNLKDLNIEKELLPLFDYSLNIHTKEKIIEILKTPLHSITEISERQNILKGFVANNKILKKYSYSASYINEVRFFLNDEKIEDVPNKKLKYRLFTSKNEKIRYASKFNQLILFLHRLQSKYFLKLDLKYFPEKYSLNIKRILQFLSHFELNKYEHIIREYRLKDKHIIKLTDIINELKKGN